MRLVIRALAFTFAFATSAAAQTSAVPIQTKPLDPANLDRAEASILGVIRGVRERGVTDTQLSRAIVSAEANYAFDIETAEGLAKTYGTAETTWTIENELAYLSRLRETTAAEIQAVARKYLGDDNYARVKFAPQGSAR